MNRLSSLSGACSGALAIAALGGALLTPPALAAQSQSEARDVPGLELQRRFEPPPEAPRGVVVTDIRDESAGFGASNSRQQRSGRPGGRNARDNTPNESSSQGARLPPPLPSAVHGDFLPSEAPSQQSDYLVPGPAVEGSLRQDAILRTIPIELPPSILTPGEPVPVYPTLAAAAAAGVDPFADSTEQITQESPVQEALPPLPELTDNRSWREKLTMAGPFSLAALASVGFAALFIRRRRLPSPTDAVKTKRVATQ